MISIWCLKQTLRQMLNGRIYQRLFESHFIKTFYALFFHRKHNTVSTMYVTPPHWHCTGSWNPSPCKKRTYLFYTVSIMGAGVLATHGARESATMTLTMLIRNNSGRYIDHLAYYQGRVFFCRRIGRIRLMDLWEHRHYVKQIWQHASAKLMMTGVVQLNELLYNLLISLW